jgi:alcohol dehydrogenase class IV
MKLKDMTFTFATPPRLLCGAGTLGSLANTAGELLGQRLMIVTDAGVVACGLLDRLLAVLRGSGCDWRIFDAVVADPPEDVIQDAAKRATNYEATGVIGFGGGSAMDVAKLVALLAAPGSSPLAHAYGVNQVKGRRLPLVLVPTTAGTGSEVTPIAIVTVGGEEKKGVVSPMLIPDLALLDAELTLALPPHVTAATGIDAMVHAIEAYTSASANNNPISRVLAREALHLLGTNLAICVENGSDLEARQQALLGACLAGQAFANSPVAAVHALAYPLGARFHLPHGLTNALMLPAVMRFNLQAAAGQYAELLSCTFPDVPADTNVQSRAESFIAALESLIERVLLPRRLRDVGIGEEHIAVLAEDAMKQTRLLVNNPRTLELHDAVAIYRQAW